MNNAGVRSDKPDPNNGNNIATASTTVATSADIEIVKTSDAAIYKPSTQVKYQISVTNKGPSTARNVVVTDNLPALKQVIYQSDTGGCTKSMPSTLVCNVGDLGSGQNKSFFVYVTVKGAQGNIANTASSTPPDPNVSNNTSTRTVTIGKP